MLHDLWSQLQKEKRTWGKKCSHLRYDILKRLLKTAPIYKNAIKKIGRGKLKKDKCKKACMEKETKNLQSVYTSKMHANRSAHVKSWCAKNGRGEEALVVHLGEKRIFILSIWKKISRVSCRWRRRQHSARHRVVSSADRLLFPSIYSNVYNIW